MSYLRAYLIKADGFDPALAACFSISQLWRWHVQDGRR